MPTISRAPFAAAASLLVAAGSALAQQQTIQPLASQFTTGSVDATLSANEYGPGNSFRYGVAVNRTPTGSVNVTGPATSGAGGGTGFSGILSNAQVFMQSSGGTTPTLSIGLLPGASFGTNDVFVMWLNTDPSGNAGARPGQINDFVDIHRNAISTVNRNQTNGLPFAQNRAQYAIAFSQQGVFAYSIGSTGALSFVGGGSGNTGDANRFREIALPYVSLGLGGLANIGAGINWTVQLTNATLGFGNQFASNETLPATTAGGLNSGSNPGNNTSTVVVNTYNRFVPTPGTAALVGLGVLAAGRRRR